MRQSLSQISRGIQIGDTESMSPKNAIGTVYLEELRPSPRSSHGTYRNDHLLISLQKETESATRAEHELTVRDAIRKWPQAVLWAFIFGSTIVMEGYDVTLIGAFWGYPQFQQRYGKPYIVDSGPAHGQTAYQVSPAWQSGTQAGTGIMTMVGILLSGTLVDISGYRPVFLGALLFMSLAIFGTFFAKSMTQLFFAELLLGIPWGAFSSMGPSYASEIAPVALRAYLTTYINLCWIMGQLIATGVLRALLTRKDEWGYRIPFAIQWIWPLPIALAVVIAPESPWHLVRKGRLEEARKALTRCCRPHRGVNIEHHLSMMIHTNELERRISHGTSYLDCLRGIDLRRTEISCMAWAVQQFCGSPLSGQAIYFFTVAGLNSVNSYNLGIGTFAVGFCGTVISWALMAHHGRRDIYLLGTAVLAGFMLCIGCAAVVAGITSSSSALYVQAGLMLGFVFVYDLSVGPVAYSLVTEISSTRLRAKTVGLARCFYQGLGIIANIVQPYLINPVALNLQGRVAFIWAGLGAISTVWIYFRLPEPKDRTYEELDIMFEKKLDARQFKTHVISTLTL